MLTQKMFSWIAMIAIALLALNASADDLWAQCQSQEIVELTASDAFPDDIFGYSVDIDGDVAVAGGYQEEGSAGAAYVYRYDGTNWIEEEKLIASDATMGDHFGWSVAVSGDTIVVGARFDNLGSMVNAGSAYVFVFDGSRWSQAAKLVPRNPFTEDKFGQAVAIDGDRIIVGAHHDNDDGGNSGAAFIYDKPPGGWTDMRVVGHDRKCKVQRLGPAGR